MHTSSSFKASPMHTMVAAQWIWCGVRRGWSVLQCVAAAQALMQRCQGYNASVEYVVEQLGATGFYDVTVQPFQFSRTVVNSEPEFAQVRV